MPGAGWLTDSVKVKTAAALQGLADDGCKAFLLLTVGGDQKSVVSLGHELGLTGTDYLWLGREMHTTFNDAGVAFPRSGVLSCLQVRLLALTRDFKERRSGGATTVGCMSHELWACHPHSRYQSTRGV